MQSVAFHLTVAFSKKKFSLSMSRAIKRSFAGKTCWSGAGSKWHGLVTERGETLANGMVPASWKGGLGTRVPCFSK